MPELNSWKVIIFVAHLQTMDSPLREVNVQFSLLVCDLL